MDLSFGYGALGSLPWLRHCRVRRASSYDRSGGNADRLIIQPGETECFAQLPEAGVIRHLWFGGGADEAYYHRKVVLRIYWDNEPHPSVEVPLGDFFGVGHGAAGSFYSLPLSMYVADSPARPTRNCWFPMPYASGARLELVNECSVPYQHYFYVDYEEHQRIPDEVGRFHAQWRRENPTQPVAPPADGSGIENLTGAENYVVLEATGRGQYVGCVLSVQGLSPGWWGEGDDMVFADEEIGEDGSPKWPPGIHGTGTEDFMNFSYEFPVRDTAYGLYHGVSLPGAVHQRQWETLAGKSNQWSVYRFHIQDPIPFQRRILVSCEHGHGNDRADDWSSVAYWYQLEPHAPFPEMLQMSARLPRT
ncbi:MAG: DUF2961 domain-containing protein [Candidatus Latescibacteria bacterium]|nr:DUF2961 domain-containing protein [Candidatus Latescibacterota bacterium]